MAGKRRYELTEITTYDKDMCVEASKEGVVSGFYKLGTITPNFAKIEIGTWQMLKNSDLENGVLTKEVSVAAEICEKITDIVAISILEDDEINSHSGSSIYDNFIYNNIFFRRYENGYNFDPDFPVGFALTGITYDYNPLQFAEPAGGFTTDFKDNFQGRMFSVSAYVDKTNNKIVLNHNNPNSVASTSSFVALTNKFQSKTSNRGYIIVILES